VAKELGCAIPCAALGGIAWGWAGADGGGAPTRRRRCVADHAAEIAVCSERTNVGWSRHFKKVDRDLCWSPDMRFRFIEDRATTL